MQRDSLATYDDVRSELAGIRVEIANLASGLRKEMRFQTWCFTTALLASVTVMAAILRLG